MNKKDIYLIGDVHGKWTQLYAAIKEYGISNCILICVGDLGIGFSHPYKEDRIHKNLNTFFKQRKIFFKSIRGNHDDPSYFQGNTNAVSGCAQYSNFELIKDYETMIINDERWLFVGGATSIDRVNRMVNFDYWENEKFVFDPNLAVKSDVLVTHSAPSWSGPLSRGGLLGHYAALEEGDLHAECNAERTAIDELYSYVEPKKHYAGHFHSYYFTESNGSISIILKELQIKQHR